MVGSDGLPCDASGSHEYVTLGIGLIFCISKFFNQGMNGQTGKMRFEFCYS